MDRHIILVHVLLYINDNFNGIKYYHNIQVHEKRHLERILNDDIFDEKINFNVIFQARRNKNHTLADIIALLQGWVGAYLCPPY